MSDLFRYLSLPLILLVATYSWFSPFTFGDEADVYVFMTPLSYIGKAIGENFDVNINILNAIDLRECHFSIRYDASSLDAIQVNPGSFFPPEPSFEVTKDPNQGLLDVTVSQESPVPLLWNGSIFSVIFNVTEAPSSGVSSIRFEDVGLWNTESESIDFQHSNALFVWITSGNSPADRSIDLYSQRGGIGADEVGGVFLGNELIDLTANVTYNSWPEQNSLVAFQVIDPLNQTVAILFAQTNEEGLANTSLRIPTTPESVGVWTIVSSVDIACEVVVDTMIFFVGSFLVGGETFSLNQSSQEQSRTLYQILLASLVTGFIVVYARKKRGARAHMHAAIIKK